MTTSSDVQKCEEAAQKLYKQLRKKSYPVVVGFHFDIVAKRVTLKLLKAVTEKHKQKIRESKTKIQKGKTKDKRMRKIEGLIKAEMESNNIPISEEAILMYQKAITSHCALRNHSQRRDDDFEETSNTLNCDLKEIAKLVVNDPALRKDTLLSLVAQPVEKTTYHLVVRKFTAILHNLRKPRLLFVCCLFTFLRYLQFSRMSICLIGMLFSFLTFPGSLFFISNE